MKLPLLLVYWIGTLYGTVSITYLRPKNDRGPGIGCMKCLNLSTILTSTFLHYEAAMRAGVDCIERVERHFFKNDYSEQIMNLAVFHSRNLSSPAMEIEVEYLWELHNRILHQEDDEDSFQLKVISNMAAKQSVKELLFSDITLTDFYVVVADHIDNLLRSIKSISLTSSFNEEAKYLILINNPRKRDGGKLVASEVLELLFVNYRAVNTVILYASDAFSYDIYTGDPYHGDEIECGKMTTLNIGRCTNGKFVDRSFTKKQLRINKVPTEMNSCTFNFCARVQEPFVNEGCHDGLEILIMQTLQEEMGFDIATTCSVLDRGEPTENGTWTDLLGQVRTDACDIIAGAFFPDPEVHADFAGTDFYLQDFYTFYVQKAALAPRWKGLVTIFKIKAWSAFGVVLIVSWIFWLLMGIISRESQQHHQVILTFMNVLAVSLGVSANNRPLLSPLRVFFCVLALYALTITAIYTSKLITVFTHPKFDHQIDTIEELLEIGLPIGGRLENMDWFDNGDELDELVFDQYNHSVAFRPSTASLARIKNGEIALLVSKLYVRSNKYRNSVHGITSSMFSNHLEMIVERGFPLLRRINEVLAALRDMGFISKLFIDFKYNMTILTPIREMKALKQKDDIESKLLNSFDEEEKQEEDPEVVLTVQHLEGAFSIVIMGLIVSSAVFILEIIFHSQVLRKLLKMIWKKVCSKNYQQRVA